MEQNKRPRHDRRRATTLAAVLLLALLCLMPRQAAAQQAHLQGTVTDDTGSPLELAVVRLEGTGIGTVTNLQGHYSLSFQTSDTVTVVFSMMGFETRKRKLVRPQGNLTINITLPIMNYELGEVSITERRRQTGSMQLMDARASRLMPDASGGNIESMLATQAGVSSNNELSSQYNVRGGSFDENLVYVNGIEVYRPLLIRAGQQEGLLPQLLLQRSYRPCLFLHHGHVLVRTGHHALHADLHRVDECLIIEHLLGQQKLQRLDHRILVRRIALSPLFLLQIVGRFTQFRIQNGRIAHHGGHLVHRITLLRVAANGRKRQHARRRYRFSPPHGLILFSYSLSFFT